MSETPCAAPLCFRKTRWRRAVVSAQFMWQLGHGHATRRPAATYITSCECNLSFNGKGESDEQSFGTDAVQTSKTPCCVAHEFGHLRSHWWWFTLYGVLLILCGFAAIGFPMITSLTSRVAVAVLSAILFIAGIATIISAFWTGKWTGMLVNLLVGLLYLGAGMIAFNHPLITITILTLYLAIFFMVVGAFRAIGALVVHYPQWGWSLLNGVTFLRRIGHLSAVAAGFPVGARASGGGRNVLLRMDVVHVVPGHSGSAGREVFVGDRSVGRRGRARPAVADPPARQHCSDKPAVARRGSKSSIWVKHSNGLRETSEMKNACSMLGLAAVGLLGVAGPVAAAVFPAVAITGATTAGITIPAARGRHVAPNPMPEIAAQRAGVGQQRAMQQSPWPCRAGFATR